MDRYEIATGSGDDTVEKNVEKKTISKPPYVEDTAVLICFDPDGAEWFVKVKSGEKDWVRAKFKDIDGYFWDKYFKNRVMAEVWCKEKGLI